MKNSCLLPLVLACAGALAQSPVTYMPEGTKSVSVGLALGSTQRAEGSSERTMFLVPHFSILWSNGVFLEGLNLGLQMSEATNMQYGPTLFFDLGSERADGLGPDGKKRFVPGAFFNFQPLHNVSLQTSVRYGAALDGGGVLFRGGAVYWMPVASRQFIHIATGFEWGDETYMQSYYGVSAQQAGLGKAPAYHASAGINNVSLRTGWRWQASRKYTVSATINFSRLRGSAADSPIIESRAARTFYTSLTYRF
ncbi:MipA/OmpV family protein [Massilia glaciei]|uniref:MipA/OmpV family protein n=1 Tax=Massilia glaciei TaxID=1524097 RepID=A0A2U2HGS3_9BURK|nr:MipA/OmpV family protein [Massilia glaciei]PWF44393.1 MipA/OmpV family protein [Massilia glaciei]